MFSSLSFRLWLTYALVVGVPARQVGWRSAYGEQITLPLKGVGRYICPHTGDSYELVGNLLERKQA